jgi:ABC-2 type transport system permease protein
LSAPSAMLREAAFLLRQKAVAAILLVALCLSALSIISGRVEVAHQRATIAALKEADALDRAEALAKAEDWGGAAYDSFHVTYDPPSDLAFAALGQRDVAPWKHRIHMLALEGQIYAADTGNPELAVLGRVDFAFVVAVLVPLFVILLLHDLKASERAAGRFDLVTVTAGHANGVWLTRAAVLLSLLALAVLVPFWIGAMREGTDLQRIALASAIALAHLLFWGSAAYAAANLRASGPVILTTLLGLWMLLAVIVPAISKPLIEQAIPLPRGGDIVLLQRETVNDAWDIPKEETMRAFFVNQPEWASYGSVTQPFEWKWYYAFQQVGDETVEPISKTQREGILARDHAAAVASLLSPPALVERTLQRLAGTDVRASMAYDAAVRAFHAELREWYYPKLFRDEAFESKALSDSPTYNRGPLDP